MITGELLQGQLTDVTQRIVGSETSADHLTGGLVLLVYDSSDFDDTGGDLIVQVDIDESYTLAYDTKDDDLNTITLIDALPVDVDVDTQVFLSPLSTEKLAQVSVDEAEEAVVARIPYSLSAGVEEGLRSPGEYEAVLVELQGLEYVVVDFPGKEDYINGDALDPTTVPDPGSSPISDAPSLSILAGLASVFVSWPAVAPDDPYLGLVYYEVHVSSTSGFTPSGANLYSMGISTNVEITSMPDGSALSTTNPTYVKVRAFTTNEQGPYSVQASTTALAGYDPAVIAALQAKFPITGTDIADDSITSPKIVANTITAADIAALTITAAQIAANTITASKIAATTITASQIAAGTITATQIAAGTITATQIAAGTITTAKLSATAIDGMTITGATFQTASGVGPSVQGMIISADTSGGVIKFYTGSTGANAETAQGNINPTLLSGVIPSLRLQSPNISGGQRAVMTLNYGVSPANPYVSLDSNTEFISTGLIQGLNGIDTIGGFSFGGGGEINGGFTSNSDIEITGGNTLRIDSAPTTTSAANVRIGAAGLIQEVTSLSEFKLEPESITLDDAMSLLKLTPRTWFDRAEVEARGGLTKGLRRVPGVFAEDVKKFAPMFVTYGKKGKLTGVAYDRIPVAELVLIQNLYKEVAQLKKQVAKLTA